MAMAIYGGMNKKENCVYYMNDLLHTRSERLQGMTDKIAVTIGTVGEKIESVQKIFGQINEGFTGTSELLSGGNAENASLVQLSQNFAPIVDAITEISDQTHLLSLNASIEAARAGVAGKGFAIVAHEVDKLSSETAEEVEKITPMVKELIDKINQSSQRGLSALNDLANMKNSYEEFSSTVNTLGEIIEELADESAVLATLEEDTK
jgi:methyl-accepting chemotaxis protein